MDGGGRLARSLRLPRPQTDLKAAALGAAILLRAWIATRWRRRTPRPEARRSPQSNHRLIVFVERYVPRRIGIVATVALLLGSAAFGVVEGGHVQEVTTALSVGRNAIANAAGFRIVGVAINGHKQ